MLNLFRHLRSIHEVKHESRADLTPCPFIQQAFDRSGHFIFPGLTSKVTILKKSSTVQKFKVQGINPAGHMRPPVQKFKDQPYGSKFKAFGRSIVQKVQPLDFPLRSAAFRKARRILLRCLGSKSLP